MRKIKFHCKESPLGRTESFSSMSHGVSKSQKPAVFLPFLLSPLLIRGQASPVKCLSFLVYKKLLQAPAAFLCYPQGVKRRLHFLEELFFHSRYKKSPQMIYNTLILTHRCLFMRPRNPNSASEASTAVLPGTGSVIRV